jgi:hypothetical protein
MSKQTPVPATQPKFDREVIRELARCFARAAVDELIAEGASKPATTVKRRSKPKRAKA